MFYSTEVLKKGKHGIATIWLMATLGHKPRTKKISKKTIQAVNIPKACHTVTEPEAPMALRLQSNLLIGISRVFWSQCNYVLTDAESARQAIRWMVQLMGDSQLDPNAGRAKLDQLVLQDDPMFAPDAFPTLDMDLANLELSMQDSLTSSQVSFAESTVSGVSASQIGGFEIAAPSADSITSTPVHAAALSPSEDRPMLSLDDDQGFVLDPGFKIDAEGNIIDTSGELSFPNLDVFREQSELPVGPRMSSERHEVTTTDAEQDTARLFEGFAEDLPLPPFAENIQDIARQADMALQTDIARRDDDTHRPEGETVQDQQQDTELETAALRSRRRRPRGIPVDARAEMRSSELQQWQLNYLTNMRQAKREKQRNSLPTQAKKVAYHLVWGRGLGDVGSQGPILRNQGPFKELFGQSLRELILGVEEPPRGKKRSGSPSSEESDRRVRRREDDIEQGRGLSEAAPQTLGDEPEIEIGRTAPGALDDVSSQMPWNTGSSAAGGSRAGSFRPGSRTGSVARVQRMPFSAGGEPSSGASSDPLARLPRRRTPSASPLLGRGHTSLLTSEDDGTLMQGMLGLEDTALEEFELPGPDPGASSHAIVEDPDTQSSLHTEEANFLNFVQAESERQGRTVITFEQLLPTRYNNEIVATQGFLNVLFLASAGHLNTEQDQTFGAPLKLSLTT